MRPIRSTACARPDDASARSVHICVPPAALTDRSGSAGEYDFLHHRPALHRCPTPGASRGLRTITTHTECVAPLLLTTSAAHDRCCSVALRRRTSIVSVSRLARPSLRGLAEPPSPSPGKLDEVRQPRSPPVQNSSHPSRWSCCSSFCRAAPTHNRFIQHLSNGSWARNCPETR